MAMVGFTLRATRGSRLRRLALATCGALVFLIPAVGLALLQLPYDTEYEVIGYSTSAPNDPVARLQGKIDGGEVELQFDAQSGYLASLLRHLKIPVSSQILVFSDTSFQIDLVSPQTPRAIYFNDDVYVAWPQGGSVVEVSAVDRQLGAVFYTLSQKKSNRPRFERQTHLCLRCHDSYSLTGGGVPRYIMGSGFPDQSGQLVSHQGWHLTTDQSPLSQRWGGWYVTGTHGNQVHMGNLIARDAADAASLDLTGGANLTDLGELIDTSAYLGKHSDIVALMVIEHQVHVQNLITRVNYDTRTALHNQQMPDKDLGRDSDDPSASTLKRIETIAEPLLRAMLFVDEAPLSDPIKGTSGFSAEFVSQGPRDEQGRSLRQLDLNKRLFRYPCSYLIYSEAFDALPDLTKKYIFERLKEVLDGQDRSEEFAHLSDADRHAIREILEETQADFPRQ